MGVMSSTQLSISIKKIGASARSFREDVQEALVSGAYYALKDGDVGPLNRILEAVGDGTRAKGITAWVELASGAARIAKGAFVINKKIRNESGVTCPEDFAPFEAEMRKLRWWEIVGKEKITSVFDEGRYMNTVYSKLESNGFGSLAAHLKTAELEFLAGYVGEAKAKDTEEAGM